MGAVLISPCVSDGERQIPREALPAGLLLVGDDAAEINYHGMKPESIDALARVAAMGSGW